MVCRSALYYRNHPEARAKKKEYDTVFNRKPEQVNKRIELKRENSEHDRRYGKASRKGKDLCHTRDGLVYKKVSVNRGARRTLPVIVGREDGELQAIDDG